MLINVIKTLDVLTKINLSNYNESEEFLDIKEPILSWIIASGDLIKGVTKVPKELEGHVNKLNELLIKL